MLLLDEPASGLDPRARIELMEILRELCRMGKTIFISSHILSELGTLCDCFTIIDRGHIKYTGPMEGLQSESGQLIRYDLALVEEHLPVEECLRQLNGVTEVRKDEGEPWYSITFDKDQTNVHSVLRAAIDTGGQIASFKLGTIHLNEAFMKLTDPGVPT